MAANTSPIFERAVIDDAVTFTSADTTSKKTILTGATDGTRVDSIMCSTNDTVTVNLAFYIEIGGTDYYIGNVNLPIGAGYTTVARVEAMATLSPTLGYLVLENGNELKTNCVATMSGSVTTTVVAMGGDF